MKKIPIPNQNQPVVKQPEGTALINQWKWKPYNPPPFYDEHEIEGVKGYGKKKIRKRTENIFRQEQPVQKRAPFKYPVLKFKNYSTSNVYLEQWIYCMKIDDRFDGVYAKDEITKDMIKSKRSYIINLDNSIGNGTHWTCFYYYRNKIEYFDSYGLKPPQFIASNFIYIYI